MKAAIDHGPNRSGPGEYLNASFQSKGIGGWRELYLDFLRASPLQAMTSLVELGSGSSDFLRSVPQARKVAVDIGDRYAGEFRESGIDFHKRDLNTDTLADLGRFDIVICSDVFEHLIDPAFALANIRAMVGDEGVLISHVPNEFSLRKTLSVMMGRSTSMYFHKSEEEWTDPHFRRFTRIGFERFLRTNFQYNVPIQHLKHSRFARFLRVLGGTVPYCLEGGPTFISTNHEETARNLSRVAEALDA